MAYSARLKSLGPPTLEYRRERADMVEVYKILHDIDSVDKSKFFFTLYIHPQEDTVPSCLNVDID